MLKDMDVVQSAYSSAVHSLVDLGEEDSKTWFISSPSSDSNFNVATESDTHVKPVSEKSKCNETGMLAITKTKCNMDNHLISTMRRFKRFPQLRKQLMLFRERKRGSLLQ